MKSFKEGELKVVDYILNVVFNIGEGDWGNYEVGNIIKYDVELNWLDMKLSENLNIEGMMMEISENKLWENFKIKNKNNEVVCSVNKKEVKFGDVYEVCFEYKE